jgi:putative oxidoreductase
MFIPGLSSGECVFQKKVKLTMRIEKLNLLILPGRVFFSLIFILSGIKHFTQSSIDYGASKGVWMPEFMVPAAGVLAVLGGLSIAFGYKTNWGALLIVAFLVPVTLVMHNFWTLDDPMQRMMQKTMFMKNLSMLGGAMLIAYYGAGAYSLDEMLFRKKGKRVREAEITAKRVSEV